MAEKRKIIQIPRGTAALLMKRHGCSKATVYNALRMNTATDQAKHIRQDALTNLGGRYAEKVIFC